MVEAWIQLRCPACERTWESSPTDLPPPGEAFECASCGETRSVAQFMKDQRDLEILKQFTG
jgi:rRNA maturation endonuclease Nob1